MPAYCRHSQQMVVRHQLLRKIKIPALKYAMKKLSNGCYDMLLLRRNTLEVMPAFVLSHYRLCAAGILPTLSE